jgi:hypothetical protein
MQSPKLAPIETMLRPRDKVRTWRLSHLSLTGDSDVCLFGDIVFSERNGIAGPIVLARGQRMGPGMRDAALLGEADGPSITDAAGRSCARPRVLGAESPGRITHSVHICRLGRRSTSPSPAAEVNPSAQVGSSYGNCAELPRSGSAVRNPVSKVRRRAGVWASSAERVRERRRIPRPRCRKIRRRVRGLAGVDWVRWEPARGRGASSLRVTQGWERKVPMKRVSIDLRSVKLVSIRSVSRRLLVMPRTVITF